MPLPATQTQATANQSPNMMSATVSPAYTGTAPPATLSGPAAKAAGLGVPMTMKKGGAVKKYAKGGAVSPTPVSKPARSSASSRGDGCAIRGRTKGKFV